MEIGHVIIQIRLADLSVGGEDVNEEGVEIDGIEFSGWVIKNGIVDVIDCRCVLVAHDVEDHLVCFLCPACGGIGGIWLLWRWLG